MAEFSKLVITKNGQALIAKMIAGIGNIEFTKVSASSATYTDTQLEGLTCLSNEEQISSISKVIRTNEVAIQVEAVFTNTELKSGYYMRALGLYAVDPDEGEILYAVTIETSGNCYMPAYNGVTVSGAYIHLVTTVGNAENVYLDVNHAAVATIGDLQELKKAIAEIQLAEEELAAKLSTCGAKIIGIYIPKESWVQEGSGFTTEVAVAEATEGSYPSVSLHRDSLELAMDAEVCPTVEAFDGGLRFWANKRPSGDMKATAALLSGSPNLSGTAETLPIASDTALGCIKVQKGSGLNIDEDGNLSLDKATAKEVEALFS